VARDFEANRNRALFPSVAELVGRMYRLGIRVHL
jgi:hypothetical protein